MIGAELAMACGAIFASVGVKSVQQLNVMHHKQWAIIPTSIVLTTLDLTVFTWVVTSGASVYQCMILGAAAGMGSLTAMTLHRRIR